MRSVLTALVSALLIPTAVRAAVPTCAFLDPEKSPRAALLEAKLLADAAATWVERADIDKILKEQKLQAAFSPQGVADRVRLGKLLKADILVMVRPVKDPKEKTLEVVVSETAGGLRLSVQGVPITKDAEADVAALLAAVKEGIKRHGEKVKDVVAVPPFVSRDLEFTRQHLMGAYAKLAETEALNRKGVLVVELQEAEALANEIALADAGAKLNRRLPLYLLGEYRHEGSGKQPTVALKLRAERGGKPVGKPTAVTVKPDESPTRVRQWAAKTLDAVAQDDKPRPPADPKVEAKQLAKRAEVFRRLQNWPESLALIEASLLLDPAQPGLHADAIKVLTAPIQSAFMSAANGKKDEIATLQRLYARGLAHQEAFFTMGGDPARYRDAEAATLMQMFRLAPNAMHIAEYFTPALRNAFRQMQEEERAAYLRLIPFLARRGKQEEVMYVWWAIEFLPQREKYLLLEKIIDQLRELPDGAERADRYASQGRLSPPDTPEYRDFLARLARSKDKQIQAAAAQLAKKREEALKASPARYATNPAASGANAPGPEGITLRPVALTIDPTDAAGPRALWFSGILAAGASTDVVWAPDAVYLMKEKGKLRLVWRAAEVNDGMYGFSTVCFDGKYVWAAHPRSQKNPILLVIDPETGKVWDASGAEGLPRVAEKDLAAKFAATNLMVTALEPGRACLAGEFLGRAWVGTATFDRAAGKATVKVIHEAREASDQSDKEQWRRTTVTFQPRLLATLTGPAGPDGKPTRRVLVGRYYGENYSVFEHPLVIDPDRRGVEVLADRVWACPTQGQCAVAGGAVYFVEPMLNRNPRRHLVKIGFPGEAKESIAKGLAPAELENRVVVYDGRIHIVLEQVETMMSDNKGVSTRKNTRIATRFQWWTARLDGKDLRQVATRLPRIVSLGISAHYGLVAWIGEHNRPSTLNVVTIPASKPK